MTWLSSGIINFKKYLQFVNKRILFPLSFIYCRRKNTNKVRVTK
jgi:hypothetical protein